MPPLRNVQYALVALGANLPNSSEIPPDSTPNLLLVAALDAAARALASPQIDVMALSRFYATPCFPPGAGPDYVNAAALLGTALDPEALLQRLHRTEALFGRRRRERWGQRTLDLDLLAYGDLVLPDAATQGHWRNLPAEAQARLAPQKLILPHPRLQDRAFVLVPLADIAADWRHPILGLDVTQMLNRLDPADIAAVRPL